jgi:hypothetical protein
MDQLASLPVIPPPQVLDVDPERLEAGFGPFDLDLSTAVRQQERDIAVEQNSQLVTSPQAPPVAPLGQACALKKYLMCVLLGQGYAACNTEAGAVTEVRSG